MTTRAPAVPTIVTPAHLKTMHALSSYQSSCQLMQRQETVTTTHLIFILIMSFIATTTISDPRSSETNTCLEPMFLTETYSQARQSEQQYIEQRTSITNAIRKSSLFDPKKKTQATKPANKQIQKEQNAIERPVASEKICGNMVQSSSTRQSLSDGLKVNFTFRLKIFLRPKHTKPTCLREVSFGVFWTNEKLSLSVLLGRYSTAMLCVNQSCNKHSERELDFLVNKNISILQYLMPRKKSWTETPSVESHIFIFTYD